jgi:hypothetical protein
MGLFYGRSESEVGAARPSLSRCKPSAMHGLTASFEYCGLMVRLNRGKHARGCVQRMMQSCSPVGQKCWLAKLTIQIDVCSNGGAHLARCPCSGHIGPPSFCHVHSSLIERLPSQDIESSIGLPHGKLETHHFVALLSVLAIIARPSSFLLVPRITINVRRRGVPTETLPHISIQRYLLWSLRQRR